MATSENPEKSCGGRLSNVIINQKLRDMVAYYVHDETVSKEVLEVIQENGLFTRDTITRVSMIQARNPKEFRRGFFQALEAFESEDKPAG